MTYQAPIRDLAFCLDHVVDADRLAETEMFAEATAETRAAILDEAGRLVSEVVAPTNRDGDLHPARLENGVVRCSPGFADAYRQIAEGGWVGLAASTEAGGMGLPLTLGTAVNEMLASANLSLSLCPLLSQGQIEALEAHAPDEIRAVYLPKLTAGTWTGTMNLTEPAAGSDVGAVRSRAEPNGDGSYSVTGEKIYISWGDHDIAENVCHLVLARLPDAAPGTKGLSLFLVPKLIPDEDGRPGVANKLKVVSLEHKMGLHGSPTAVMAYEGATGWLIGPEHGGIACMFTMMNNARLGVGVEGLGIAEAAYQKALEWAVDREQGRTPDGSKGIVGHADVRRMLFKMKTLTEAARAICLDCAVSLDMARAAPGDEAKAWAARAAFLTPIAKAFGTDVGNEVAHLGVQVHGGMGVIEETGAAQYSRDVRVTTIYEGTNGIQAMDLAGRKLSDKGAAAGALLAQIREEAEAAAGEDALKELGERLGAAADAVEEATAWMLGADGVNERFAGAADYLRAWALTLGAAYLLKGARAAKGGAEAERRAALAAWFARRELPLALSHAEAARQGAALLYALTPEELASSLRRRTRPEGVVRTGLRFPWETPPEAGATVEVAEGVLWTRLPLPMRLDHVNVYLLDDGDGWTVVDTGFSNSATREIWEGLLGGALKGRPLRRVVATHHHPDHIGMAGWLMARGAELWTTRTAYYLARMLQLDHHEVPAEESVRHYLRGGAPDTVLERYRAQKPFNFSRVVEKLPLGFRRVAEGETVRMGGRDWRVRMGNGHAPEHATFWSESDNLVLAGDQAIAGISSNLGVHATEPEADPVGEWLESCERLLEVAREDHLALPGHKVPFTGLPVRFEQLIDNHHGALDRLRRHLTEPRTAAECFLPIFGREIEEAVYGLALAEAIGHLNHMHRTGEAAREEDPRGAWRFRLAA